MSESSFIKKKHIGKAHKTSKREYIVCSGDSIVALQDSVMEVINNYDIYDFLGGIVIGEVNEYGIRMYYQSLACANKPRNIY